MQSGASLRVGEAWGCTITLFAPLGADIPAVQLPQCGFLDASVFLTNLSICIGQ